MTDWRSLLFAPPSGTRLCGSAEVQEGQGREIVFGDGKDAFRVVVFRLGQKLVAYHNCCPHFSLALNYEPDKFHVFDDVLMCAHHVAMFRLDDGECFDGPCQGSRLTPIEIESRADALFVR